MSRVKLYYNPECGSCVTRSKMVKRLDWFDRVEVHTEPPPSGPLPLGAIALEDPRDGRFHHGADAIQRLWFRVPLLWPIAWLMYLPPVRRAMEPVATECHGETCRVPPAAARAGESRE